MFKLSSEEAFEAATAGGVRHLFQLGQYEFLDALDDEEDFRQFIIEVAEGSTTVQLYEIDGNTMYEFMARFLAGAYEMEELGLDQSPAHNALLDVLEIATARARSGEAEFSWEEFDEAETEVMDDEEPEEEEKE